MLRADGGSFSRNAASYARFESFRLKERALAHLLAKQGDLMLNQRTFVRSMVRSVSVCIALSMLPVSTSRADDESQIKQGFAISPVPLNLAGKNRALVGLGSYIVNTSGCNDCHTHPEFLPGHNPFLGQPEQINAPQYLSGGRQFGPFTSANITPDALGRPAGLDFDEFVSLLRTGHDPDAPGRILQVMPWPVIGKKTDRDLRAIYEYLSAIPSLPDNPDPGP